MLSLGQLPGFFVNSALIAVAVIADRVRLHNDRGVRVLQARIRGKEIYFWMLLAALTLPGVVLLTPLFATVTPSGPTTRYGPSSCPVAALRIPFAVLLARNFVDGIPDETGRGGAGRRGRQPQAFCTSYSR